MKRLVLSVPINAEEQARITSMMASEQEGCETAAEVREIIALPRVEPAEAARETESRRLSECVQEGPTS